MLDRKLFTSPTTNHARNDETSPLPVLPLPVVEGRSPLVLVLDHAALSVAMAYDNSTEPHGSFVRAATRETTLYSIPCPTLVFAVSSGHVIAARTQTQGDHRVVIDHGDGWLTVYGNLEHSFVRPRSEPHRSRVNAGDPIGYMGATREGPLHPLHFELWRANPRQDYDQIDPIKYMRRWRQIVWQPPPELDESIAS